MQPRTSQLLGRLSESATIAMSRKARELKAAGRDIISLSLGEPDFDTPDPIKAAGIRAIEENHTHYPPVPGFADVRDSHLCQTQARQRIELPARPNRGFDRSQAQPHECGPELGGSLATKSSSPPLSGSAMPTWSTLLVVKWSRSKTGIAQDFKMTADQLRGALTERTRVVMLNSPNNPSGKRLHRRRNGRTGRGRAQPPPCGGHLR